MTETVTEDVLEGPDGSATVYYCDGCDIMLAEETVLEEQTCRGCGADLEVPDS